MKAVYYFVTTSAPHIAFLFAYTAKNSDATVLFSPLSVVTYKKPDLSHKWNNFLLNKSLSDLVFFAPNAYSRQKLFNEANKHHPLLGPFNKLDQLDAIRAIITAEVGEEQRHILADYITTDIFRYWAISSNTTNFLLKLIAGCLIFLLVQIPGLTALLKRLMSTSLTHTATRASPLFNRYSYFSSD